MDYDVTNQMILQRYKLILANIDFKLSGFNLKQPLMFQFSKKVANLPKSEFQKLQKLFEASIVNAFLLDDIQDSSKFRYEKPTAHRLYGTNAVINCCVYSNVLWLKELLQIFSDNKKSQALKIVIKAIITICSGQGMEIYWRDYVHCPTEEQYIAMIQAKTGYGGIIFKNLFNFYAEDDIVMDKDLSKLILQFSIYVQMRNDYVNLKSQKYGKSKGFCEDITDGKFSLQVIHAITTNQHDTSFINILKQRTEDDEIKKHFVDRLEKAGSLKYAWNRILEVNFQVQKQIKNLGGHHFLEKILKKSLDFEKSALW